MAEIVARNGTSIFDSMLGDIDYPKDCDAWKLYPFMVRCGVIKDRAPRHEFFEYILDMGKPDIVRVLEHKPLMHDVPMDLTFVFPERWMAVGEQVMSMSKIMTHPDMEKIGRLDLITSSPMLVGNFLAQQVRILTWPGDEDNA